MSLYYSEKDNLYYASQPCDCADSPRTWSHDSIFITFERNYRSPDENPFEDWDAMLKHFGIKESSGEIYTDMDTLRENALKKGIVAMPVWKYDHSGLLYKCAERYPFHDGHGNGFGWDGGIVGIIYEKRNRRNIDDVIEGFKSELEDYTRYANGEIYSVAVYTPDGEMIDSIGGIYEGYGDEKTIKLAVDTGYVEMNGSIDDLEEVHYEQGYMPVDIDPDLVDDEYEYEDMEYRSLTIEERIEEHQEYIKEYRQESSLADQIKDAGSEKVVPETVDTKSKDLEI